MPTAREEEAHEERETSLFARIANFTSLVSLARCITYHAPFTSDAPATQASEYSMNKQVTLLLKLALWLRLVPQSKGLSEILMTMTKYFF